ncbi:unnamed protein product [Didymodactylos carnosus]|uniref:NAD(P)(+)--arginine ADP-ribosyltransferase n=1 Tax=Didymodactylos carnosus TaxID=1234261 RepID=A0A8S2EJL2_9BILA|nr:unnamed protein product [Didymodactylos carnosus]CAF4050054.1 unnamed protein product [Didymodactylos carnosus]
MSAGESISDLVTNGATTASASRFCSTENLFDETYQLVWLDQNVNETEDNLSTQQKLRGIINHLKVFTNIDECEQYIHQGLVAGQDDQKVVLVVSGRFGRELIPRIHQLTLIVAVYIYCMDKESNKQWADQHQKIKDIFTDADEMIRRLKEDQRVRERIDNKSIGISIYSRLDGNGEAGQQQLQERNALFLHLQMLIEILLRMKPSPENAKKDLINYLNETFKDNDAEVELIGEFVREYKPQWDRFWSWFKYKPEKAIWWYTRESCFYRLLNKALRCQDFDILIAFRFFIIDLYRQLTNEHAQYLRTLSTDDDPILRVYRGQGIGVDELHLIRESVGEFLSMNSFLSTTTNPATARRFAKYVTPTNHLQRIQFEFVIDIRMKNTRPFANIRHLSYFQDEDEVLIMCGSIFKIKDVQFNQEHEMWIAQLTLCSDDDYALKEILVHEKKDLGSVPTLMHLGQFLCKMGEYDKGKMVFRELLNEASSSHHDAQSCYLMLGAVALEQKQYQTSLANYFTCLQIQLKTSSPFESLIVYQPDNSQWIAQTYSAIARVYSETHEFDRSLDYSSKALTLLSSDKNHRMRGPVYRTMANVYRDSNDQHQYELALQYYNKAFEIQRKTLPKDHQTIGETYQDLALLYEKQQNYTLTLQSYTESLRIQRKTVSSTHKDFQKLKILENNIEIVKQKIMNQRR